MILALDLGSTSFKAGVLDEKLRILGSCAQRVPHQFAPGGKVEIGVDEATSILRESIRQAMASARIRAANLHVIAPTSQAQTFTVISGRGQPSIPFISWQDSRAIQTCQRLRTAAAMHDFG